MEKLTTIEQVDIILFILKDKKEWIEQGEFNAILIKKETVINNEKVLVILDFLYNENLINRVQKHTDYFKYRINIKGLLFDGYVYKQRIEATSHRNERIQTFLLVGGTTAAGAYGIFEILRWFFHHEGWKLLF